MIKKTFLLMAGLLIISVNAYAAGDLVVMGNLGVGESAPSAKADIVGNAEISYILSSGSTTERALIVNATADNTFAGPAIMGINAYAKALPSAASGLVGFQMQAQHETDQNIFVSGGQFLIQYRSDFATTMPTSVGLGVTHTKSSNSIGVTTITDGYGLLSKVGNEDSNGKLVFTNFSHIYAKDIDNTGNDITTTSLSGMWIDQQTNGTNNYGIVLNGDGAGSDLVFGPNQESRIYSQDVGGVNRLYAQDESGNQTVISPHDPVTGEWIFYSKNVKTGRTVRVDMEKLVKAVEKLTGETFMVENLIQE